MAGYCFKCGVDSDELDAACMCRECADRWRPARKPG